MIILTTLLLGISTSIFNFQPVKAGGTIYIRADGSVDPPTAPISSVENVTYTFTDDIYDEIVVERDDIVVDGAGYTVQGTGSGTGIYLSNRSNVTIKNTEIKIFDWGIILYSSSNNSIFGNNITENNGHGIFIDESSNNTVSGNNATNNTYHGIFLYSSENNLISNNLVENSGYNGIFLNFADDNLISNNTCEYNGWHDIRHGIELHNSEHNLISNNTCSSNYDRGISLSHSDHNTISYNICENNYYHGIHIDYSLNNTISNNTCEHNGVGLNLDCSSSNTISNNTCENNANNGIALFNSSKNSISRNNITANNESGVWLDGSNNNSISGNTITANTWSGIGLPSSSNNTISGNTMTYNEYGIYLDESSNNTIHHNIFVDNTKQVFSLESTNVWDAGYPSGGNYWSDYTGVDFYGGPYQDETGSDSIGDTPYVIDEDNQDSYPFMSENGWWRKQVETATGTGTATFETDAGAMEGLTAIDEATLPPEGKPDIVFPHGFFSFKVTELMPGQTVTITITLPFAMPPMSEYWKYHDPEGYLQIPLGSNDGDEGITITLTDGGTLDGDGAANGEIVDDGGPAQSSIPVGGIVMPGNRLEIAAPLIGQYALVLVTAAITVIVAKRIISP